MTPERASEFHHTQTEQFQQLLQTYSQQKTFLIQKNRDNLQNMQEIYENLKVLKEENVKVIQDLKSKHQEELDALKQD